MVRISSGRGGAGLIEFLYRDAGDEVAELSGFDRSAPGPQREADAGQGAVAGTHRVHLAEHLDAGDFAPAGFVDHHQPAAAAGDEYGFLEARVQRLGGGERLLAQNQLLGRAHGAAQARRLVVVDLHDAAGIALAEMAAVDDKGLFRQVPDQGEQARAEFVGVNPLAHLLVDDDQVRLAGPGAAARQQGTGGFGGQFVEIAEVETAALLLFDVRLVVGECRPAVSLDQHVVRVGLDLAQEADHLPPPGVVADDAERAHVPATGGDEVVDHITRPAQRVALLPHGPCRQPRLERFLASGGIDEPVDVQAVIPEHPDARGGDPVQDLAQAVLRQRRKLAQAAGNFRFEHFVPPATRQA